jgi:pyruvate/2-oxoacid:ferredoxin oxidoreductase beta subunit
MIDHVRKFEMIEAMRADGGSFIQALAECFARADMANQARLEQAFPEYVEQYLAIAGIRKGVR